MHRQCYKTLAKSVLNQDLKKYGRKGHGGEHRTYLTGPVKQGNAVSLSLWFWVKSSLDFTQIKLKFWVAIITKKFNKPLSWLVMLWVHVNNLQVYTLLRFSFLSKMNLKNLHSLKIQTALSTHPLLCPLRDSPLIDSFSSINGSNKYGILEGYI